VLCFEAATGKKQWERQFWATGNTVCNAKTCMAGPTPVTDGKRVVALFATGDLACLDADGDLLWYRALARDYPTITNQVGMAASPILWEDMLLLPLENAGESFVAGLDANTGKNRWKAERARDINWATPVLFGDGKQSAVLFQSRQEITAYDPATGKLRWTYKANGLATIPSPLAGNGLIFVPGGELTALRPVAAKDAPEVVWQTNQLRTSYATPLLYKDRLYAVNSAGVLNCVEARDGNLVWQERLKVKAQFSASPVAGDGKVYLVNEEGTTVVVQVGDQPRVLATNKLDETLLATPALSGGALFLRSDQHLYCIGEKQEK
jgi:outer membrane protein assembly factor BamB